MKIKSFIFSGLGIMVVLAALIYAQSSDGEGAYSVYDLKQKIDTNDDIVLIDVRTAEEYTGELGHIDGSILLPVQELSDRLSEIGHYRDSEVVIICRTDNRSRAAASLLREADFRSVSFVRGGMIEWNEKFGTP